MGRNDRKGERNELKIKITERSEILRIYTKVI